MANTTVTPTRQAAGASIMTGFPFFAFSITTNDTNIYIDAGAPSGQNVAVPVSVYVGVSGNVKVTPFSTADANAVTFTNVPAGTMLPVQVNKVWATGTTATGLIGIC